jgi:hypothetical protein
MSGRRGTTAARLPRGAGAWAHDVPPMGSLPFCTYPLRGQDFDSKMGRRLLSAGMPSLVKHRFDHGSCGRCASKARCGPSGLLQHICQFLATRLSGTRHRPTRTSAQGSEHPRPSGPTCTRSMCPLSGQSRLISPARSSHHAYRPCAEPATVSNSSTRESALLELQISTDSA